VTATNDFRDFRDIISFQYLFMGFVQSYRSSASHHPDNEHSERLCAGTKRALPILMPAE
jgi:hypothetical protein